MTPESNQKDPALTRTSYWLMPVAEDDGLFVNNISQLSDIFDGPVFAPHLTVYSGPASQEDDLDSILRSVAPSGGELVLRCTGIEFSEMYTKNCVLNFTPDPMLNRLCEALRLKAFYSSNYQFAPHLSLFYGNLTEQDHQQVRKIVKFPETIRFGKLVAMATSSVIKTSKDVHSWRQLGSHRF